MVKLLILGLVVSSSAYAQQASQAQTVEGASAGPCTAAERRAHDFRVGDWNVYAPNSEDPIGRTQLTPIAGGCAYRIQWQQLNDQFAVPETGEWFAAEGVIGYEGGKWVQVLADNRGGFATTYGAADENGVYFDTPANQQGVEFRSQVTLDDDGVVWSETWRRIAEDADWERIWRLRYEKISTDASK